MNKIFDRLVEFVRDVCDPEAVLLFGSYAKGNATADSDIDLIVVCEFGQRKRQVMHEIRGLMARVPVRVDVLLISPAEREEAMKRPTDFLGSALSSATQLYPKQS